MAGYDRDIYPPVMWCIQHLWHEVAPCFYQHSRCFLSWNMHTQSGMRVRMGFCWFTSRFPMFPVLVIGLRIVFLADRLSANQGSEVIKCGTLTQLRVCMQISKITACFITMHLHYYGLTTNIVCVNVLCVISPGPDTVTWLNVLTLCLSLVSQLFNGCSKRMKLNDTCRDPDSQRP